MLKNSHTIVICSRKRSLSLENVISSILNCRESENVKILVVLNGHSSSEFNSLTNQYADLKGQIEVLESKPGLAAARNVALSNVLGDIITFLDDDVLLPIDYLTEIDLAFSTNDIGGLSPRIAGLYNDSNLAVKRFSKRRIKFGRLTKNGENFWVPDVHSNENTIVDWLPGCSMSYRRSSITNLKFSEELMLGPTGGYSLGEDVDFSIRVSKLIALNSLSINHLQADSVRDDSYVMSEARGRWKAYLVRKYPQTVSKVVCITYLIMSICYFAIRCLINKEKYLKPLLESRIQLKSFIQELTKPILVSNKSD